MTNQESIWPGGKGKKWVLLCSLGRAWELAMVSRWAQHVWVAEKHCLHPQETCEKCCGCGSVAAARDTPGQKGVIKTFLIVHSQCYRFVLKKKKNQPRNVIDLHFPEALRCHFWISAWWAAVCSLASVVILPCPGACFRRRLIFWKCCFVSTSCKGTHEKVKLRHLCFTKLILHQQYTISLTWAPKANC